MSRHPHDLPLFHEALDALYTYGGMTQEAVGKYIGKHNSHMSRISAGRNFLREDEMDKFCDLLREVGDKQDDNIKRYFLDLARRML